MTDSRDLTPFLYGLTPDPDAMTDARAFSLMLPEGGRVAGRLEDLLMCFAFFVKDNAGPRLPGGHAEALNVFAFALSGLYALLEDGQQHREDGWATLARARLWALDKCQRASTALTPEEVEGLHLALSNPDRLPPWAAQVRQTERATAAGRLAGWGAVSHLLETAHSLEDGDAEELTAHVLGALADPASIAQLPSSPDDLPFPDPLPGHLPTVYEAQHVEDLPGGRVRVCMGGGEDYDVGREDVTFTPLPDGAAFLAIWQGTPDAVTVRLSPSDARQVRQALGLSGEEEGGQASPLN